MSQHPIAAESLQRCQAGAVDERCHHTHSSEEVAELDWCLKQLDVLRVVHPKQLQSKKKEAMQERDLYADAVTYYDSKRHGSHAAYEESGHRLCSIPHTLHVSHAF